MKVKRASDSHIGVPSQCFVTRSASIGTRETRGRGQYLGNLVSPPSPAWLSLLPEHFTTSSLLPGQLAHVTDSFREQN